MRHVAAFPYQEAGLIGVLIRTYKYSYAEDAEGDIARILEQFFCIHPHVLTGADSIVPVPLHRRRFAERGFNQAERIACIVGRVTGIPVSFPIDRIRNTPHQARLSRVERLWNVRDAFGQKQSNLRGTQIVLVDDVFTTGTTMQECAKVLLSQGARKVIGFTLARG